MPLSANTLPFNVPLQIAPFDANLAFGTNAAAETKTATGYYGAPTQIDIGVGRIEGYLALPFTARKISAGDESYTFHLMGSNDAAWGNGNVEILQTQNFGAARGIATIPGASPAMPTVGPAGEVNILPFSNLKSGIVYRYVRLYVVIAGTSPTCTVNPYISYDANCC